MNTVYVVQETDHNIMPARNFGNLLVMISGKDLHRGWVPVDVYRKMVRMMTNFCNRDYLLCVGDPVLIGLAIKIAMDKTNGSFVVLRWNKQKYSYEQELIDIYE